MNTPTHTTRATTGFPALLRWVGGGVALLLVVGVLFVVARAEQVWLEDVTVYDYEAGVHIDLDLEYPERPAVGGPHHPVWQNCGVYADSLVQAHVVHSLEHGAVWITYDVALVDADGVDAIVQAHGTNPYVIVSPYPGQDAPVIASAWNRQLRLDGPDDERLGKFVTTFANGPQSPEPGAPCTGGTDMVEDTTVTPPAAPDPTMPEAAIDQDSADTLIGLTEAQARERAVELGWQFRVGVRDGQSDMLTTDYVLNRVTVTLAGGVVTVVAVG